MTKNRVLRPDETIRPESKKPARRLKIAMFALNKRLRAIEKGASSLSVEWSQLPVLMPALRSRLIQKIVKAKWDVLPWAADGGTPSGFVMFPIPDSLAQGEKRSSEEVEPDLATVLAAGNTTEGHSLKLARAIGLLHDWHAWTRRLLVNSKLRAHHLEIIIPSALVSATEGFTAEYHEAHDEEVEAPEGGEESEEPTETKRKDTAEELEWIDKLIIQRRLLRRWLEWDRRMASHSPAIGMLLLPPDALLRDTSDALPTEMLEAIKERVALRVPRDLPKNREELLSSLAAALQRVGQSHGSRRWDGSTVHFKRCGNTIHKAALWWVLSVLIDGAAGPARADAETMKTVEKADGLELELYK